ncbi:hypothetical protein FJ251_14230 [bacterium]|nr:hypothetical protein [bacterium]
MNIRAKAFFAIAALLCLAPAASALAPYAQDFEGLVQSDPNALGNDGWLVFGNVFGPDWSYWYGYGPYPAPNAGNAFCSIAAGEGGAEQGAQQLVVFSDYNNGNHNDGAHIESNVFQEQTIGAGDVGTTWNFDFDAKLGNLAGSTTALAFIKTLDPASGYAMTNFITADMTSTPASWTGYQLTITIDAGLVNQILQIGFANTATLYEGSGVFYDNIVWGMAEPVATQDTSWGAVKSLF